MDKIFKYKTPHPTHMPAAAAHPVLTLRELVTTLEAAITLTLASPKTKSVHRLRTTTRRIEAQLELLTLLPDLPKHAKFSKKARKLLRILRRAAGQVRDLDVQRKLTQSRSKEAEHLRDLLKQQRDEAADHLLDTIHEHQPKLTRALEALLKALAPAESLTLSAVHLAQLTLHWYAHNTPATPKQNHRQLHNIRKAAKLARYIAQSATPDPKSGITKIPTHRLARTFESLQQSGGEWHDWLTMSGIAHRELGSSSPLARTFARRCDKSLADYQRHLKLLSKNLTVTPPVSKN
jgi:hypothetical protein